MRTTVRLPDSLYRSVQERAHDEHRTVTSFIEEALRARLAEAGVHESRRPRYVVDPVDGSGVMPGVDLGDSDTLIELMEG